MENKIIEIIKIGWLSLVLLIFILAGALLLLTEQERLFYTDKSCSQIKECVLMDMFCLDETVNNKFFFLEWEFNKKALLSEQKDYYKLNCLDANSGKR